MIEKRIASRTEYDAVSDEQLVNLFLESNDNRYFQELYERYALKVFQKCLTLTRDNSRAQDLAHDVFLKLIFKMNTFKKDAKFSTWLFSITYNHCMDLLRASRRTIITVYIENFEFSDQSDMYKIFNAEELDSVLLGNALNQLTMEEKGMLYLKYLDERSIRDIASIFKLTESAVKMRLMRSREKLRKKYSESLLTG